MQIALISYEVLELWHRWLLTLVAARFSAAHFYSMTTAASDNYKALCTTNRWAWST